MASAENIYNPAKKGEIVDVVRLLLQERMICIDFLRLNPGKRGLTALVQIGTLDGCVYLFDLMKKEIQQDKTFFRDTGLDALLTSPEVIKVINWCGRDNAALFSQFGIKLENIFDTKVAHIVIQEDKGIKYPRGEMLSALYKLYSGKAMEYEGEDDVKLQMIKKDGLFWARRPLTKQMIEYASANVTLLTPVYLTQKRYLEENNLVEKFNERVKEEAELVIERAVKEKQDNRLKETRKEILQSMAGKYQCGASLSDVVNEDEIEVLRKTTFNEISTPNFKVIRALKLESLDGFLTFLKNAMGNPEKFCPKISMHIGLNVIFAHGTPSMKDEGNRIKKTLVSIVVHDINKKFNPESELDLLTGLEYTVLKSLRPLCNDGYYPDTVLALHWRVVEKELDKEIERLDADPAYEVKDLWKLVRFVTNRRVPDGVKANAFEVLYKNMP